MKIDFLQAGIDSLEISLEQLSLSDDRYLRASIMMGHHSVACFLKTAAINVGLNIVLKGTKTIDFPTLLGALKSKGMISSQESKSLHLLNILRNSLEHNEAEYDKDSFVAALHGVMPILERILRESGKQDIQEIISKNSWDKLMMIEEFYHHREKVLDEIVENVLDKPMDKDYFVDPATAVFCEYCGKEGLPWSGEEREEVMCKFCGEKSIVAYCAECSGPICIQEKDEWPYIHGDCWDGFLERND